MGDPTVHVVTRGETARGLSRIGTTSERAAEQLRDDIEHTRAEMGETIDAIQRKLDPERLKEQARERIAATTEHVKEEVREATVGKVQHMVHRAERDVREARRTVMDTIRDNPIPAAMVAGGLAWLIMGGRSEARARRGGAYSEPRYIEDDYDLYGDYEFGAVGSGYEASNDESSEGPVEKVRERARDVASAASAKAHEVSERAQREGRELRQRAGSEARRMERGLERTYRENPIGFGVAAMAIGSLLGAALPRTRREDELLGRTRDKLMNRARDVAEEAVEKVRETADEKLGSIRSSAP